MPMWSKYRQKHYREVDLTEVQCGFCGNWFAVDLEACDSLNEEWDRAAGRDEVLGFYCPYCLKLNGLHV